MQLTAVTSHDHGGTTPGTGAGEPLAEPRSDSPASPSASLRARSLDVDVRRHPEVGYAAEFTLRDFGAGRRSDEQRHAGPLEEHPLVAVLATATDSADDWLLCGQALMRVLLAAADDGYVASYINQPIEVPGLRQQLRNELRLAGPSW